MHFVHRVYKFISVSSTQHVSDEKKNGKNISQILAYQNYNRNVSNSGNPTRSITSVFAVAMLQSG